MEHSFFMLCTSSFIESSVQGPDETHEFQFKSLIRPWLPRWHLVFGMLQLPPPRSEVLHSAYALFRFVAPETLFLCALG